MTLSYILFLAAVLIWPLRRICRAGGVLLPFFSVLLTAAAIVAGLMSGLTLRELALGPMAVLLAAVLIPEGGGEE